MMFKQVRVRWLAELLVLTACTPQQKTISMASPISLQSPPVTDNNLRNELNQMTVKPQAVNALTNDIKTDMNDRVMQPQMHHAHSYAYPNVVVGYFSIHNPSW